MGTNQDEKIEKMTFASVFPHYQNKVERKGQSLEEALNKQRRNLSQMATQAFSHCILKCKHSG